MLSTHIPDLSKATCKKEKNTSRNKAWNQRLSLGVTMMPLGAPSISKYGSLVRPDAQIVALRAHCARTALEAPPLHAAHKVYKLQAAISLVHGKKGGVPG